MSSYVQRAMQDNEKIIFSAQLHWIIYRTGIMLAIFGGLVGALGPNVLAGIFTGTPVEAVGASVVKYLALGIIVLGAFDLLASYIRQISTELVITDQRVIAKHGFISTTSYELMLTKVEGATIDQSVMGRLLGYGTLMVKGTGGGISPIDHVAAPYLFHQHLMNALRIAHDRDPHHD